MNKTQRKTYRILLFIVLFLLGLIVVIFFTQYNSQKNISNLIEANKSAALTFDVNNRLQEVINLSIAVEKTCRNYYKTGDSAYAKAAKDTVSIIENNLTILNKGTEHFKNNSYLPALNGLVLEKMSRIKNFLVRYNITQPSIGNKNSFDSLLGIYLNENIYLNALAVQQNLENNLKKTLSQSSNYSKNILKLDKILSIVAIMTVLILGTFIISRLLQQLSLISTLAAEKERADKSAMIKEQFLANMSHEIRTPINAVIGFSGLLQKTPLESDQKQFVDLIQKSGDNLLAVVNDILDISKLEAGMLRINKNPFSLSEICMSMEMMFFHKASEKNISFSCTADESIPDTLVGDSERLNQVLINLINNALKFTPEGEVDVNINLAGKSTDKVDLIFSVKDSGIGIPKEKFSSIFERFEQADSDTSRQYGGTGLGLSIVKKIINLQGGDIYVKSEPGKGSEFIFNLSYEFIENPEVLKNYAGLQNPDHVEFSTIKALVAEDNLTNQTLLKFTLKQWNLNYDLAENGEQAVELLRKNNYDIILMDIQMPVMDGYEAAKKIRSELNQTVPIIAMTAHVLPTEREKCINAGMNDYISKPIKEAEFLKLLKKYLPYTYAEKNTLQPEKKKEKEKSYRYIDLKYLQNIFAENNGFINEIMYQFREEFPKELQQLQQAADTTNMKAVTGMAHHMKTTVSTLSIDTPLRIHLEKIENAAKEENWAIIKQEVTALLQKEAAVLQEVNTILTTE